MESSLQQTAAKGQQPSILNERSSAPTPPPQGYQAVPPSAPSLVFIIKPSLIAAISIRLFVSLFLIAVTIGAIFIANNALGINITQFVLDAANSAVLNLGQQVPIVEEFLKKLFNSLQSIVTAAIVLIAAAVLLKAVPLVSKRWKVYSNHIEYATGFLSVKEEKVPIATLALIDAKKVLPLIDIGEIIIVVAGTPQPIHIPMVVGAMKKAERIRTLQRALTQPPSSRNF